MVWKVITNSLVLFRFVGSRRDITKVLRILLVLFGLFFLIKPAFALTFKVTISNPNSYDLQDYQVRIAITKAVDGDKVFDFYDDFNDGVLDGTIQAGKYTGSSTWAAKESNGLLVLENPSDGTNGYAIYVFDYIYTTGELIEARMQDPDTVDNSQMGIALTSSTKDIAARRVDADGISLSDSIIEFTTSGSTTLAFVNVNTDTNYHVIGLAHDGSNIYMFVDGVRELTTSYTLSGTYNIGIYIAYTRGALINVDWIRVRKYADTEPSVSVDTTTKTITISNPNSYDLIDFQVRIPLAKQVYDIQLNGKTVPFCYEHSNGECDANPSDVQAIWVKVNISANSEITLKYIELSYLKVIDSQGNLLNFCYEQNNGECNTNPSNVIWVKVNLTANSNTTIYIVESDTNYAKNGDEIFDFYDDFNDGVLDLNKWVSDTEIWLSNTDYFTASEDGGYLKIESSSSGNRYGIVTKERVLTKGTVVEWDIVSRSNANIILVLAKEYGFDSAQGYEDIPYDAGYYNIFHINAGGKIFEDSSKVDDAPLRAYVIYDNNGNLKFGTEERGIVYSESSYFGDINYYIGMYSYYAGYYKIDWIRVRKYADQEPSITVEIYESSVTIQANDNYYTSNITFKVDLNIKAPFKFRYKRTITVSSSSELVGTFSFTLDTATLISEGKLKPDCSDIAITDENGNYLPIWVENCNSANSKIYVKINKPGVTSATLILWYGSDTYTNPYTEKDIYNFYYEFPDGSNIDTNLFDVHTVTIDGYPVGFIVLKGYNPTPGEIAIIHFREVRFHFFGTTDNAGTLTSGEVFNSILLDNAVYDTNAADTNKVIITSSGTTTEFLQNAAGISLINAFKHEFNTTIYCGYNYYEPDKYTYCYDLGMEYPYIIIGEKGIDPVSFELKPWEPRIQGAVLKIWKPLTVSITLGSEEAIMTVYYTLKLNDIILDQKTLTAPIITTYTYSITITKEGTYQLYAEVKDVDGKILANNTTLFTLDLYDFEYADTKTQYYISLVDKSFRLRCGALNHNITVEMYVDEVKKAEKTYSCNNSTITDSITTEILKEGTHTIYLKLITVDPTDTKQLSAKNISLDLYDENVTYSNFTEYNSSKYVDTLDYKLEVRCGALNHNITIDAFNNRTYTITCDNSTKVIEDSYRFSSEGQKEVWFKLNAVNSEDSRYFGNESFVADLEPPKIEYLKYTLTEGFRSNYTETGSYKINDTISPYVYCEYKFNNENGNETITNYTQVYSHTFNLTVHNNLSVTCWDVVNHSTTKTTKFDIGLYHLTLVDEYTNNLINFSTFPYNVTAYVYLANGTIYYNKTQLENVSNPFWLVFSSSTKILETMFQVENTYARIYVFPTASGANYTLLLTSSPNIYVYEFVPFVTNNYYILVKDSLGRIVTWAKLTPSTAGYAYLTPAHKYYLYQVTPDLSIYHALQDILVTSPSSIAIYDISTAKVTRQTQVIVQKISNNEIAVSYEAPEPRDLKVYIYDMYHSLILTKEYNHVKSIYDVFSVNLTNYPLVYVDVDDGVNVYERVILGKGNEGIIPNEIPNPLRNLAAILLPIMMSSPFFIRTQLGKALVICGVLMTIVAPILHASAWVGYLGAALAVIGVIRILIIREI